MSIFDTNQIDNMNFNYLIKKNYIILLILTYI